MGFLLFYSLLKKFIRKVTFWHLRNGNYFAKSLIKLLLLEKKQMLSKFLSKGSFKKGPGGAVAAH